jgi:hypothetical protein
MSTSAARQRPPLRGSTSPGTRWMACLDMTTRTARRSGDTRGFGTCGCVLCVSVCRSGLCVYLLAYMPCSVYVLVCYVRDGRSEMIDACHLCGRRGDMSSWPPETWYRCVEGCKYMADTPPSVGYAASKMHPVLPAPELQFAPCSGSLPESAGGEL